MESVDRNRIKANGWALGKFFSSESASLICCKIRGKHKGDDCVFIAVTHDCSVVSPSLENEPFLEYLSVKQVDKGDGQFTNARNIRRLHLEVEKAGDTVWYEATMAMRGFVCRKRIDECLTDNLYRLSSESLNVLKRWLANRYISQTFPDRFNDLTNSLVKNSNAPLIKAFNTKTGKACNSIFISLTPDDRDLNGDESYDVLVTLLFRDEMANEIGGEEIDRFGESIKSILDSVEELDPVEVVALAESNATYSEIVKMSRWQLDYVSIKDGAEILSVDHS